MTVVELCMIWWTYKSKLLAGFYDLRVCLALHEIDLRRQTEHRRRKRNGLAPKAFRYNRERIVNEIHGMVGGAGGRHIRAALRRLEAIGLAEMDEDGLRFAKGLRDLKVDAERLRHMVQGIDHRKNVRNRTVPVPRSMLVYLAGGSAPPAVAATMFAHAIRCLWLRAKRCRADGSCSASFVADVFDIHIRTVKSARKRLHEIKWLIPLQADPYHVNTNGARVLVNLNWSRPDTVDNSRQAERPVTESPPPSPANDTKSPPPVHNNNLPSGSKNQHPASGGADGVRKRTEKTEKPDWRRIVPADLRNSHRLNELFAQAIQAKLVTPTESDRLRFFAAAEHAVAFGAHNPCGLFVAIVKRELWHVIRANEEDAARRRLRVLDDVVYGGRTLRISDAYGQGRARAARETVATIELRLAELVSNVASARCLNRLCGKTPETRKSVETDLAVNPVPGEQHGRPTRVRPALAPPALEA